jgi:hypothetical protein
MNFAIYKRHGILLLSTFAASLFLLTIGCSQSNTSKIIGSWKSQHSYNSNKSSQYTLIKFYKEGLVSRKDIIVADEELSKKNNKIIGKYTFNDDKTGIKITWDNGNSEIMDVSFPQKNRMLLGKYEMEKIK